MDELDVYYREQRIGLLIRNPAGEGTLFYYDEAFRQQGIELSPFCLSTRHPDPHLKDSSATFCLPGMIYDSLPDSFGTRVIKQWFARKNRPEPSVFDMLSFLGDQGFGALRYRPSHDSGGRVEEVSLDELNRITLDIQNQFAVSVKDEYIYLTSSAGGAQRKAIVFRDRKTGKLLSRGDEGLEVDPLLVKFPDKNRLSYPEIEHAYCQLARECGIRSQETMLLEVEGGSSRCHCFAALRFDRSNGERLHYHSLKGMREGRYENYAIPDYVDLAIVTLKLTGDFSEVKEVYRRALFNVLADNTDDHPRNHGFLFDGEKWSLSPAFDLTFRDSSGAAERGLNICGRSMMFTREFFHQFAEEIGLDTRSAKSIDEQVIVGMKQWRKIASESKVDEKAAEVIFKSHEQRMKVFGSG